MDIYRRVLAMLAIILLAVFVGLLVLDAQRDQTRALERECVQGVDPAC